jgi:hypothetical protein
MARVTAIPENSHRFVRSQKACSGGGAGVVGRAAGVEGSVAKGGLEASVNGGLAAEESLMKRLWAAAVCATDTKIPHTINATMNNLPGDPTAISGRISAL